jgi:hypothetical protein
MMLPILLAAILSAISPQHGDVMPVDSGGEKVMYSVTVASPEPDDSPPADPSADQAFLEGMADSVVSACQFTITSGTFTGKKMWSPGGNGNYYGYNMVVRDQTMMARGWPAGFTEGQLADLCDILAYCQGASGDDGVQDGMTQGSTVFGYGGGGLTQSPTDEGFEFVDMVYSHFLKSGTATKFTQWESKLMAAYNYQTVTDHLCDIREDENDRVGFGFVDSINLKGRHTMMSLYRYRAAREISEMLTSLGRSSEATPFTDEMPIIASNLKSHLFDNSKGLFRFDDVTNTDQHDVWASAYAVVLGAVDDSTADKISDALWRMLPTHSMYSNGCFQDGQIRTFPKYDPYFTSFRTTIPTGEYQNGGYWGTATGWVAKAVDRRHHNAALNLLHDWRVKCEGISDSYRPYEAEHQAGGDNSWTYSYLYGANAALPVQFYSGTFNR